MYFRLSDATSFEFSSELRLNGFIVVSWWWYSLSVVSQLDVLDLSFVESSVRIVGEE